MSTARNMRRVEWHEDRPIDGEGFERYLITADRRPNGSWDLWERSTWDIVWFPPELEDMTRLSQYAEHTYQRWLRRQRTWRDAIRRWSRRVLPASCSKQSLNHGLCRRHPASFPGRRPCVRHGEVDHRCRVMPNMGCGAPRARSRLCSMHDAPTSQMRVQLCPSRPNSPAQQKEDDEVAIPVTRPERNCTYMRRRD